MAGGSSAASLPLGTSVEVKTEELLHRVDCCVQ
jgi:hypothetical protein